MERLVQHLSNALDRKFSALRNNEPAPEFEWTIQRLFDIANPSSQRVLTRILLRLVEEGVLRQLVRVESVTKGGIGEFDSIADIPPVVFDEFIGHNVEVSMDNVRMIYKLEGQVSA